MTNQPDEFKDYRERNADWLDSGAPTDSCRSCGAYISTPDFKLTQCGSCGRIYDRRDEPETFRITRAEYEALTELATAARASVPSLAVLEGIYSEAEARKTWRIDWDHACAALDALTATTDAITKLDALNSEAVAE